MSVAEVSARFNLSKAWIRAHARELGARRKSAAPKSPFMFTADGVRHGLRTPPDTEARTAPRPQPSSARIPDFTAIPLVTPL